jgi:hypothetical protein
MVTADMPSEFKFENGGKHGGNRLGALAHHIIDIGCFGAKRLQNARLALFNFSWRAG